MAGKREMILIDGESFIRDYKEKFPTRHQLRQTMVVAQLAQDSFDRFRRKLGTSGELRLYKDTYKRLCTIANFDYDTYFLEETTYKKSSEKPRVKKTSTTSKTKYKNGVTATVYTKNEVAPKAPSKDIMKSTFALNISSFRSHIEIYRKLLGLSIDTLISDYNLDNYEAIENGSETLSISTYFKLSQIFVDTYNALPETALKKAFADLASTYHDIYVGIIYFGDNVKVKKKGR